MKVVLCTVRPHVREDLFCINQIFRRTPPRIGKVPGKIISLETDNLRFDGTWGSSESFPMGSGSGSHLRAVEQVELDFEWSENGYCQSPLLANGLLSSLMADKYFISFVPEYKRR